MSWLRKGCMVILVGATLLAPVSLYAHDDDDDDGDRKRSRHYRSERGYEADHMLYCSCPAPSASAVEPPMAPPAKPSSRGPESFPRETPTEHASAKERQLELLEHELVEERRLLSKAMAANAAEDIRLHQKNIAALRRELANWYR